MRRERDRVRIVYRRSRSLLLLFSFLFVLSSVWSQTLVRGYPHQPCIFLLNENGEIFKTHSIPDIPNDVEPLPSNDSYAIATASGKFLLLSKEGKDIFSESFFELYDVDVLSQNEFLLTSRKGRRVFYYNRQTRQEKTIPYVLAGPTDADLLPNGNLLICDSLDSKIVEITPDGDLVWTYRSNLKQPMDALRLPEGNTLITDFDNHRLIEVQPNGVIVWEQKGFDHPIKIYTLPNEHILVADGDRQRILEIPLRGNPRLVKEPVNFIQSAYFVAKDNYYLCATHKKFDPPKVPVVQAPTQSQTSDKKIEQSFWQKVFLEPFQLLQTSSRSYWVAIKDSSYFPYIVLLISFILWLVNVFKHTHGRFSQLALFIAYGLVIGVAFHFHALASSKGPYRPDFPFWVSCFLLFLYSSWDAFPLFRPKGFWWPEHSFRFPYRLTRTILLLLWPTIALFFQYHHIKRTSFYHAPWYLPIFFWGIGLIFLVRPLLPKREKDNEGDSLYTSGELFPTSPYSTGSVGIWEEDEEKSDEREMQLNRHWANTLVVMTLLLTLALYIIGNTSVPTDVHGDEAEVALHGIQVRDSGNWNIFNPGWYQIPNLFYLVPGWVMWFAGDDLFGMRLTGALIGIVSIYFFYLLARRLLRSMPAALATFLFATSTFMVHFSRVGTGYNQTTLLTLITLYCVVRGLQESQPRFFVYAGIASGVGLLSYQAAKLLIPLVLSSLLLLAITRRIGWWVMSVGALCYLLAVWVMISPLIGNYCAAPETSYSRAKSVSIFTEEGMSMVRRNYPSSYTKEQIYKGQIERTLLAPITHPDNSPYLVNRSYGGMLDPLPAIFFVSGLLLLLVRIANPTAMLLLYWFLVTLIIGGMLTNNAPSYQRLTGLIPYLLLIAAPVLYGIILHITRVFHGSFRMITRIVFIVALVFLIMGTHRYFHQIQTVPQMVDEWTRIARYLQEAAPTRYTYFFGPPQVYFEYGTIKFLAPEAKGENVLNPRKFLERTIQRRGPVTFLLVRSHRVYINSLREKYPGGKEEVHYNARGRAPFITYEVNF